MFHRFVWAFLLSFYSVPSIFATEVVKVSVMDLAKIKMDKTRHVPLIEAKIAGIDTFVMLDTASHPAIFTEYFAKKIGLSLPKDRKKDQPFISFEKQDVPFQLGPITASLDYFVVVQQRDDFYKKTNIGAIYNPNLFSCKNCLVVLDFINMELYAIQTDHAEDLVPALDARYPEVKRVSAAYVPNDISMLHISGVSANDQIPGVALLDTGANGSSFVQSSIGQTKLAGVSYVTNMVGNVRQRQETVPIPISINGTVLANIPISVEKSFNHSGVMFGPKTGPIRQAAIGMDIMKNCAVAIEHKKAVHFYCKPFK